MINTHTYLALANDHTVVEHFSVLKHNVILVSVVPCESLHALAQLLRQHLTVQREQTQQVVQQLVIAMQITQ